MNELIGLTCFGIGIAQLASGENKMDRAIGLLAIAFGAMLIAGPPNIS